jgi:hypothetical protein
LIAAAMFVATTLGVKLAAAVMVPLMMLTPLTVMLVMLPPAVSFCGFLTVIVPVAAVPVLPVPGGSTMPVNFG